VLREIVAQHLAQSLCTNLEEHFALGLAHWTGRSQTVMPFRTHCIIIIIVMPSTLAPIIIVIVLSRPCASFVQVMRGII
jgi:hypothetical protein